MDIYDARRQRTGRVHRRGEPLQKGEYGLVVCVWVSDGAGRLLLTKRAPEKESFPNAWENSGGSAWAGETSRQAIARELREETGIRAGEEEFLLLESARGGESFFDFYFLIHPVPRSEIVLPLHKNGEVIGVLDIDSPEVGRFSAEDEEGLREVVRILERIIVCS